MKTKKVPLFSKCMEDLSIMYERTMTKLGALAVTAFFLGAGSCVAGDDVENRLRAVVDAAIRPVMQKYAIPGMAVAVTLHGKQYYFNYGVISMEEGKPKVTEKTIFEIGSISKIFTATLASYAQEIGKLSLSDPASQYLPSLRGSSFDNISLLDLGTYTPGGLPLQFPGDVDSHEKMIGYYKNWQPNYAAGTMRLYSNPSIGLLGLLTAESMGEPFEDLLEKKLFPMLGLKQSYVRVPQAQMSHYAYGYSPEGVPSRMVPGVLYAEGYGVTSSSADMIRFVEANMQEVDLDEALQRAITATHTGYYKVADMTQGLGWEFYPYPIELDRLLAGNSYPMILEAHEITRLNPPLPPQGNVLINKPGRTDGFGAYVAFVPAKSMGIVTLANKDYPLPAKVEAAHEVLTALETRIGSSARH
jgi:beta-lactamase class C